MKKLLMSIATIGIAMAMFGAGTFAYFSDVETITGNTITAGTINLLVNDQEGDEIKAVVTIGDMKPCKYFEVQKKITVEGNPANVWLHFSGFVCEDGEHPESEDSEAVNNDIHEVISYDLYIDNNWDGHVDAGDTCIISHDVGITLADLECIWIPIKFDVSGTFYIIQSFHMDADVTNWAQGDICTFTEEFFATQINSPETPATTGQGACILLEDKDASWQPITDNDVWGIACYEVGSLTLKVWMHGLDPVKTYQVAINSPETAAWFPIDPTQRIAEASAIASGVYDGVNPGTTPNLWNQYERGYYDISDCGNLFQTPISSFDTDTIGKWVLTTDYGPYTDPAVVPNPDGTAYYTATINLPSGTYDYIKILVNEDDGSLWTPLLMEKVMPMSFVIP